MNSKNNDFFTTLPSDNENFEREPNSVPEPLYTNLFNLAFLADLTPPNKQSFKVKSEFKSRDYASNL